MRQKPFAGYAPPGGPDPQREVIGLVLSTVYRSLTWFRREAGLRRQVRKGKGWKG